MLCIEGGKKADLNYRLNHIILYKVSQVIMIYVYDIFKSGLSTRPLLVNLKYSYEACRDLLKCILRPSTNRAGSETLPH